MRKLVIGMAMASTALASPALAKDDSWYIGAEFGAMLVEDTDFEINGGPDAHSIDHEYGFDGGGYVGYDFGAFRLEAEVSYRQADIDGITVGTPWMSSRSPTTCSTSAPTTAFRAMLVAVSVWHAPATKPALIRLRLRRSTIRIAASPGRLLPVFALR